MCWRGRPGQTVAIVDIGVASEFEEMPGLVRRKVRCGRATWPGVRR